MTEYSQEHCEDLRFIRFAVDCASIQVFRLNREQRILYVNDSACSALGYTREELARMLACDIDPGYDGLHEPERSGIWNRFRETGHGRFETSHRARDGRVYPVEVQCNFLEFEGREY